MSTRAEKKLAAKTARDQMKQTWLEQMRTDLNAGLTTQAAIHKINIEGQSMIRQNPSRASEITRTWCEFLETLAQRVRDFKAANPNWREQMPKS